MSGRLMGACAMPHSCTRYARGLAYAKMIPHLAPEPGTKQGIIFVQRHTHMHINTHISTMGANTAWTKLA